MHKPTCLWVSLLAVLLAVASAAGLVCLGFGKIEPSWARDPISDFVAPGVSLWWLVLGGPFQSGPRSAGGVAFAAIANAILWLLPALLVLAVMRRVRRRSAVVRS